MPETADVENLLGASQSHDRGHGCRWRRRLCVEDGGGGVELQFGEVFAETGQPSFATSRRPPGHEGPIAPPAHDQTVLFKASQGLTNRLSGDTKFRAQRVLGGNDRPASDRAPIGVGAIRGSEDISGRV